MGVILGQHCLLCAQSIALHTDHLVIILLQSDKAGLSVYNLCSTAAKNDRQVLHHSHSDTVVVTMCTIKWDQTH